MNKKIFLIVIIFLISKVAYSQETNQTVTYFEQFVINGNIPSETDVQTKYEREYRAIIWNESLKMKYKYSPESFDKIGYEFVKKNEGDKYQQSSIYCSCSKGIIVEVTEWYDAKLSISLQWFDQSIRMRIGPLMYCTQEKSNDKIKSDLYNSFKAEEIKKFETTVIEYSSRKNKPKIIDSKRFLKDVFYGLIQKNNSFNGECLNIILKKDGFKDLKTNLYKIQRNTKFLHPS